VSISTCLPQRRKQGIHFGHQINMAVSTDNSIHNEWTSYWHNIGSRYHLSNCFKIMRLAQVYTCMFYVNPQLRIYLQVQYSILLCVVRVFACSACINNLEWFSRCFAGGGGDSSPGKCWYLELRKHHFLAVLRAFQVENECNSIDKISLNLQTNNLIFQLAVLICAPFTINNWIENYAPAAYAG
jgi:hypothetical protein